MPKMNRRWKTERRVECLPYALGEKDGETEFCEYEADYMSGIAENVEYDGKVKNTYMVPIKRLDHILREKNITYVDFMSLDVEGSELEVLRGVDFNKVHIHCIVIENDKGTYRQKRLRKYLHNVGYRFQARLWFDEVWIHND